MGVRNMKAIALILLAAFAVSAVQAKDIIFTAPPRETGSGGGDLYTPIAAHLTTLLGKTVKYENPGNWLAYQRDMREDKYDIVFDGPHFISWRMAHLGHEVLVKFPGSLEFFLIGKKDDTEISGLDSLVAKKICGIPPPNLSTLSILAAYPNPVRQPVIKGVKGGFEDVYNAFNKGECRAAVLRTNFYNKKLKDEERAKLSIVYAVKPLPEQGISVSKRIDERERNLIIQSLTIGDGVKVTAELIEKFAGKQVKHFVPAKREEYEGINSLLEGVIFGW